MADLGVNNYIVAVIDLLGISASLENIKEIPSDPKKVKEFTDSLKPTFGRVNNFRESIDEVRSKFVTKPDEDYAKNLTVEQVEIYKKHSSTEVGVEFFSDTAILKINLKNSTNFSPITSAWNLLGQLQTLMISFLAGGWPIRGAIELGICAELEPHGLFGQAISRAHHIESKIAEYPRIVIGGHFLEYLKYNKAIMGADGIPLSERKIIFSFIESIEKYLEEDDDGHIIIDYLNKDAFGPKGASTFERATTKASEFIGGEILKFRKTGNILLFRRYQKLKKYFLRKGCWKE